MNWVNTSNPKSASSLLGQLEDIHSLFDKTSLFNFQQRQRAVLSILREAGFFPLKDFDILEIGCGTGYVLLECLAYGAVTNRVHGVDLALGKVVQACDRLPLMPLSCADGRRLPYGNGKFDLVLQNTVFSSVLDQEIRRELAREMLRVLNPERGMILWYDFWLNPTNAQTRGIRPKEIRSLFPGCAFEFRRVTLAPPIARKIVPFSWVAAFTLEKLRLLNSHYLVTIQPKMVGSQQRERP